MAKHIGAEDLLRTMPLLRATANSLTRNLSEADDLVQETFLRAWANRSSFEPGTDLLAWLRTIMRNYFRTKVTRNREVRDGQMAAELAATPPEQWANAQLVDLCRKLSESPRSMSATFVAVAALGATYEETAEAEGCKIGTVRSRMNRMRDRLSPSAYRYEGDAAVDSVVLKSRTKLS